MKNSLKTYLLSFVFLLSAFSCDDVLDVNTDPLAATSADPNVVLPYVIVQYSNRKQTELGTRTSDVPQYMSSNFNSPKTGSTTSFLTGNTWRMMYVDVLGNLALVEADAKEAGATSNNVAAIAIVLKALIYYELTSIWEDVPFTQAINGQEFPSPTFDSQETVLNGVAALLDEANTLIAEIPAEGVFDVSGGDLIYQGDMTKWEKLSNSLKLRVLMMIRNKDTSVDSQITALLSKPLIENSGDIAMLTYSGQAGAENAFQTIVSAFFGSDNESTGVHAPGPVFYDLIVNNNDPREQLFIYDPGNVGPPSIGQFSFGSFAHFSNNVIRGSLPDIFFTAAEVNFYKAELALKGVGTSNTQTEYENGVRNILTFWGQDIPGAITTLTGGEIDAYVASLPDLSLLTNADALTRVHEQQYLEAFLNPILGWNTVRRTGVPTMDPVPGTAISTYLKRFTYPPNEIAANPNTPANLPTDRPMWFE
ncbi:MAG: SusD/RagB family nutrient-binding outer membrane lipoprotein [Cyclobacteriaceae bacterium]|nr:SusD/RagB family nutrient-binding outer membrane lipoprotein [Cyclobacteriaceae bacterium]